jgi:hypothetical protein
MREPIFVEYFNKEYKERDSPPPAVLGAVSPHSLQTVLSLATTFGAGLDALVILAAFETFRI